MIFYYIFTFLQFYTINLTPIIPTNKALYPVLLIPGDGGSHLEARLNKSYAPHYVCDKYTTDWFNIWLNLELLMPYVIDCWVDNVKLMYDKTTHKTSNTPGVDIRVPGFGNTTTVEWLDPNQRSVSKRIGRYFASIVDKLITLGLTRGKTIRGAPYDFRKTPLENEDMLKNVVTMTEEMYKEYNNSPVVIICHSMGCIYTKYLLQNLPKAWKKKYLKAWITLSSPWAGTVKALKMFAAGDNLDAYPLNALKIRDSQRTYPSLSWLVPRQEFWATDEIIISTPGKNYTVYEMEDFFMDLNLSDAVDMWRDNRDIIDLKAGPGGVELHCLYGVNVSTPERLDWIYPKYFPDHQPSILPGDGDGSVNIRSLDACSNWDGLPIEEKHEMVGGKKRWGDREKVICKRFPLVEHVHILYNKDVIEYIASVVSGQPAPTHHYGPYKTVPEMEIDNPTAPNPTDGTNKFTKTPLAITYNAVMYSWLSSFWQIYTTFLTPSLIHTPSQSSNAGKAHLIELPSPPLFFPVVNLGARYNLRSSHRGVGLSAEGAGCDKERISCSPDKGRNLVILYAAILGCALFLVTALSLPTLKRGYRPIQQRDSPDT